MTATRLCRPCAVLLLALAVVALHAEEPQPRPRIGLALGGGSAKGMAHAGVLQWLEEHRVPVDAIAGASSGAFVGSTYASRLSAAAVQDMLRDADWSRILRADVPYPQRSFQRKADDRQYRVKLEAGLRHGFRLQSGLNSGHGVGLFLSRLAFPYSTVASFDDLPIPFRCVATDLEKGGTVVLAEGPLGPALRASMALPGSFDPVRLRGSLLADGGILDNVPVDVARAMGADVVIAVSVSEPEPGRPAETIGGIANRALELMMEALTEPRLAQADVVIRPDLEGLGSSDFLDSDAFAARGYAAAAAQAERLLPWALDEAAWAAHRQRLAARQQPTLGPLEFVEVTGVSEAAAAQIGEQLAPLLHRSPDLAAIEIELDGVIGVGRYASAMYDRRLRGAQQGLGVEIRDKSYAPPLVRFALDLDTDDQDVNLTLGVRTTLMDVTGLGSEWRVDAGLGSTLLLATELFQPLGGRGPVRHGLFLAPRAFAGRTGENLHASDELVARYGRARVGAGLDFGWVLGRTTELRAGYEVAHVRNVARGGAPLPRSEGARQAARARVEHDGQDRAVFPSRGLRLTATGSWVFAAPDADDDFGTVDGTLSLAWPLGPRHHLTLEAAGGASLGGTPPLLEQFRLGGPFRLAAWAPDAFRGPHFALGALAYRTPLARLPRLLGDRLFLSSRIEVGSAFDAWQDARTLSSLSAGLAADTLLGPFFVGAGVEPGGAFRAFVVVGRVVR
ncbi:MAG: patatin-like phospholipase family protein [Vicinamibacteria bacterium]|nr:patatin-like phospholipase family protein [Vicinamibacteria bacterium]